MTLRLGLLNMAIENPIIQNVFFAVLASLLTFIFTTLLNRKKRIDKFNDKIIERRIAVYEEAEEIMNSLSNVKQVPFYKENCQLLKIIYDTGEGRIPTFSYVFTEQSLLIALKKKIEGFLCKATLMDKLLERNIILVNMYVDNLLVLRESDVGIKTRSLGIIVSHDFLYLNECLSVSIRKFYASANKTKIQKKGYFFDSWMKKSLIKGGKGFALQEIGKETDNFVIRAALTCHACNNEECSFNKMIVEKKPSKENRRKTRNRSEQG